MTSSALDLSNNNGTIDWSHVVLDPSIRIIFAKCTEGTHFVDPTYIKNKAGIYGRPGIVFGAYHFARPDVSGPAPQVDSFCRNVGPMRPGDLVVLDFEKNAAGMRPAAMVEWAREWLQGVQDRLDIRPLFYTYKGFIDGPLGGTTAKPLTRWDLWLAAYGPHAPSTIPWAGMVLWQFTDHYMVNGIHGFVDESYIQGSNNFPATFVKVADGQTTIPLPTPEEVAVALNAKAVVIKSTKSGNGYWVVAADGGVFAYGDAQFFGSEGGKPLNKPISSFDVTPGNDGYWLLGEDGGVFAFGAAEFHGAPNA